MPRQPKRRLKIVIHSPEGWETAYSATPEVLAKPGVDAMWTQIAAEASVFVAKRYKELSPARRPTAAGGDADA